MRLYPRVYRNTKINTSTHAALGGVASARGFSAIIRVTRHLSPVAILTIERGKLKQFQN